MGEQSNDRTAHELLTHILEMHEPLRAQREAHLKQTQPPGEADEHANKLIAELTTKLGPIIEDDVAIDHELDVLLARIKRDVMRVIREHRAVDKEDLKLKKLAHDLTTQIKKDTRDYPRKGSIALASKGTVTIAREMLGLLERKATQIQHDDDLARRARRLLKKAIEDLE